MTGQSGRHGPDSVDDFTGLRNQGGDCSCAYVCNTFHLRECSIYDSTDCWNTDRIVTLCECPPECNSSGTERCADCGVCGSGFYVCNSSGSCCPIGYGTPTPGDEQPDPYIPSNCSNLTLLGDRNASGNLVVGNSYTPKASFSITGTGDKKAVIEVMRPVGYCGGNGQGGTTGAKSAAPGTGSGGGGANHNSSPGNGGSGVVIVRYTSGSPAGTGGAIMSSGGYTIHTFITSGTFTMSGTSLVDYLVIGGGGKGGEGAHWSSALDDDPTYGGGGGAGQVQYKNNQTLGPGEYTVVVGVPGASSSFNGTTSIGGSQGSNFQGGASGNGYAGRGYFVWNGAGGGGGSSGKATTNSDGGPGTASSITGSSVTYAGGGGGAAQYNGGKGLAGGGTIVYHDQFQKNPDLVDDDTGVWYGFIDWRIISGAYVEFPAKKYYSWTPTEPGTYLVYCQAVGSSSCDGGINCSGLGSVCVGPQASIEVTVDPAETTATIRAKAMFVSSPAASCDTIRSSSTQLTGTVTLKFLPPPASALQIVDQPQSGSSYAEFNNVIAGQYTIDTQVSDVYAPVRYCWRTSAVPASGETKTATVATGDTLSWDIGYTQGTAWSQAQGGDSRLWKSRSCPDCC